VEVIRYGIYWANLDPAVGREMKKTRPVVVISPDVMNRNLGTVLVCPLTSSHKKYPTRVKVKIKGKISSIALDQLRSIDKSRLFKLMATLDTKQSNDLNERLMDMLKK